MKKAMMMMGVFLGVFGLAFAGAAKADDLHLCATTAACVGNPGSVQPTSGTTAFIYGKTITPTPDTLFVMQLAPVAGTSGNWNSGSVWSVLGENNIVNSNYPNLPTAISQLLGAGFGVPGLGSFNVQDFQIGTWSGAQDTSPFSFTLPGILNAGDIYIAFTENANGDVVAASPWSSAIVFTPEPSTLLLLSLGLVALFALGRRRLGVTPAL